MAQNPIRILVVGEGSEAIEAVRARLDTKAFEMFSATNFSSAEEFILAGAADIVLTQADEAINLTSRTDVPMRKLAVRKMGKTILLALDEIVYVSARNKITYVHSNEIQYIIDMSLDHLEHKLTEHSFLRVHRGYLINLDKVREVQHEEKGYIVTVQDSMNTQIPVSRRQTKAFKNAIGI